MCGGSVRLWDAVCDLVMGCVGVEVMDVSGGAVMGCACGCLMMCWAAPLALAMCVRWW